MSEVQVVLDAHPAAAGWLREAGFGKAAAGEPSQLHLALGASEGEMTVTWVTRGACSSSFVAWGEDERSLHQRAAASSRTYSVPRRWWQPKILPWIHTASVGGLTSRQKFVYTVGDNSTVGCTVLPTPIVAHCPPLNGALPVRAALMADVGSIQLLGFAMWRALDSRDEVDLAVHAGDVSYAGKSATHRPPLPLPHTAHPYPHPLTALGSAIPMPRGRHGHRPAIPKRHQGR